MKALPGKLKKLYPFKSHLLKMGDGNRIHYIDEGQGDVVVMIHGNPTWSFYYRDLIKELRTTFRCIAIDNMGCGLSDKPQKYPYCLEKHIENARQVIEFLKLERFHLVMHDWGCAIGMALAERWPERISSLTIMNGAAFHSSRIPMRINLCRLPIVGSFLIRGLNAFVRGSNRMSTVKKLDPVVAAGYRFPYDSWKNRVAIRKFVTDIPLKTRHPSWETLTRIEESLFLLSQKRILLLWGNQDFCFTEWFLEEWKKFFRQASVVRFEDAGHYVLEDAKEKATSLIRQFMVHGRLPDMAPYR